MTGRYWRTSKESTIDRLRSEEKLAPPVSVAVAYRPRAGLASKSRVS